MVVEYRLEAIETAAKTFLSLIGNNKVIAFHGDMGAGKTTFIHAVCDQLGVTDTVGSPTFSIINEYGSGTGTIIYHLDLYRLKDEEEAINAGVEDVLFSGQLCLVEWPEKAPAIFPVDTVHCYFTSINDNARNLQIKL